jgi:hypothetical protein
MVKTVGFNATNKRSMMLILRASDIMLMVRSSV